MENYFILYCLGNGNYGSVFLVKDKIRKISRAMKVIKKKFIIDNNLTEYIYIEKEIMY